MRLLLLFLVVTFSLISCNQQNNGVSEEQPSTSKNISDTTNNDMSLVSQNEKFEIIKRAKAYFGRYIKARLKELDPDGPASEHVESREFYVGDINLDKIPDAIVLYNIEGIGGGNNWHRYILLLVNDGNDFTALNHAVVAGTLEGEAEFIGIENGYAIFDKMEFVSKNELQKINEDQPSKYKRIGYGIRGANLVIDEIK